MVTGQDIGKRADQKKGSRKKNALQNRRAEFVAEKKTAQDKERAIGTEVFRPVCTSDMSVSDVLVHKMGARAAKITLDKLKESENDAVMSMYPESRCFVDRL